MSDFDSGEIIGLNGNPMKTEEAMPAQNDAEPSVASANAAVLRELPFSNRQDLPMPNAGSSAVCRMP